MKNTTTPASALKIQFEGHPACEACAVYDFGKKKGKINQTIAFQMLK